MPSRFKYVCTVCAHERWIAEENISADESWAPQACVCGKGQCNYTGYLDVDTNFFWHYFPGDPQHYCRGTDGKYYAAVDGQWVERDASATAQPVTQPQPQPQPAAAAAAAVVADAIEATQSYPTSTASVECCAKRWKEMAVKTKNQAKQVIEAERYANKASALEMLECWNRANPELRISAEDVGIDVNAVNASVAAAARAVVTAAAAAAAVPAPVNHHTITHQGKNYPLTIFSDVGGFHRIFSFDADSPTFPGVVNNANVLVRIPRENAGTPPPAVGYESGRYWNRRGFHIPHVYNSRTLAADGYYVVESVPRAFDPDDSDHLKKVQERLTAMAEEQRGPDFRPDNVRFRGNGELVLIDFSENEQDATLPDFAARLHDFAQQFARNAPGKYEYLCRNMGSDLRELMTSALQPWQQ